MRTMKEHVPPKYFLYADDDFDDRQTIAEMISKIDHNLKIVVVENGIGVLNYLKSLEQEDVFPCFILLDINMPLMDGFKTLELLKSNHSFKNIPVILFTTSSHSRDIELARRLGAENLITKPFSHDGIEEITRRFASFCHELPVRRKEGVGN
jgi:CheY-like chemotaxis protein